MKTKALVSFLLAITAVTLSPTIWAAGHGGGGGGGGFISGGGGHPGGGGSRPGGGAVMRSAGPPSVAGRPVYYYSRGMHFAQARPGSMRAPVRQAPVRQTPALARPDRGATNSQAHTTTRQPAFNSVMGHVAERHQANWHNDWDRRHAHFDHHRFFVFIDGFWCGLDAGFFPWDYYPYYAYDYYPYDYYPGYYADVEPYYYNSGQVYSDTPMRDQTVAAVQTQLTQLGYYNGPVDGIFGPTTRDAVAKYQIAMNLDVTGSLSPDTLQSLSLPQATAS
jgi:Putative peptidoglycan binding domain